MLRPLLALALSALVVLVGVPFGTPRAYRAGWFERSSQTRRTRAQRRPTHGGVVLAVALALGTLVTGPSQPVAQATVLAAVAAVAGGLRAEQGKGSPWAPRLGRLLAAAAVPGVGLRAELTGGQVVDAVLTALLVLALIQALRSIERSDGTMPAVVAIGAMAFVAIAVTNDDPMAPAAAALVGTCLAVVAHAWPPAAVRLGAVGPTVLGAALGATAIGLAPTVSAPRSMLVPLLALAPLCAALVVPELDRRLRVRGVPANVVLPFVAVLAAVAAERLAADAFALVPAVGLALVPTALVAVLGLTTAPPRAADWVSHRGRNVTVGLGAAFVLGAVGVVAGLALLGARQDMLRGREFATTGLDTARDGDLAKAQELFETADVAFADAARALDNPAVRLGALVPGVAQNLHNVRTLAAVGGDLSGTAVAVAERAGADDLLVVDGRFPIEAARQVSAELAPAVTTLRDATARLAAAGSPFLVDEVREGSAEVGERIRDATDSIEVAAEATRLLPDLLGADRDRRWMVAILTPSELRGAGGLAGDYAELRTSNGDIDLARSIPAGSLNAATDPAQLLAALPEIYRGRYGGFRPGRFWQNLSATPDVPTLGQAIAAGFPLTEGGGPVDGAVIIDPYGIAALLQLTGPVTVPDWPVPIGADNAASVLLFEHYDRLTDEQIDDFQSTVVEAVVDALTSGALPAPSQLAATLAPAVTGGHLRLWSPEADPQTLFTRIGADGAVRAPTDGSDYVQLLTQNAGENKIDWFMRRSMTYEATVDPATGAIDATATVTITNTAPDRGVSSYIIGETPGPTAPGENQLRVTVLSPHNPVGAFDAAGEPLPVNLGTERGLRAATVSLEIPAGQSATVSFTFAGTLPPTRGDYRLQIGRQPAVVPDRIEIFLQGAQGWALEDPVGARTLIDDGTERRLRATFVPT